MELGRFESSEPFTAAGNDIRLGLDAELFVATELVEVLRLEPTKFLKRWFIDDMSDACRGGRGMVVAGVVAKRSEGREGEQLPSSTWYATLDY